MNKNYKFRSTISETDHDNSERNYGKRKKAKVCLLR